MSVKHQIIFLRHGRTSYSGIYPDITEEGREQLIQAAKKFRPFFSHQSFTKKIFITSPAVRAKGSGDILAKELQFEEEIFEEELLSDMHVFNWSKAKKIFNDCR
jgi:broad specificity phosphatase PhoE